MLKIDIPQTGSPAFTAAAFDQFDLPTPPSGTDAEINGDVVLLFEDEEEAVDYLDKLDDYSASLDNDADAKPYLNALINTIRNDEFVQAYIR